MWLLNHNEFDTPALYGLSHCYSCIVLLILISFFSKTPTKRKFDFSKGQQSVSGPPHLMNIGPVNSPEGKATPQTKSCPPTTPRLSGAKGNMGIPCGLKYPIQI